MPAECLSFDSVEKTGKSQILMVLRQFLVSGLKSVHWSHVFGEKRQNLRFPRQNLTHPGQILVRPGQILRLPGHDLTHPGQILRRRDWNLTCPGWRLAPVLRLKEPALRDSAPTSRNTPPPAVVRPLNLPIEVPLPIPSSETMEI